MNFLTKEETWPTLALIPQVDAKFEAMSNENAALLRKRLLQKTLHLVFRRVMQASHFGAVLTLKDGTTLTVSPRMTGYQADYPEERSIMCLKQHGGDHDCTACMSPSDVSCTRDGVGHEDRPLLPTVDAQLRAATILATLGNTRAVKDITKQFGVVPCVPALAGWAGLGSGPRLLYKAPAFDALHVRLNFSPQFLDSRLIL